MARKATGHVRQRKANLWEGQYVFQRERRSIYGRTRKEVEKELKQIVLSIERGEYVRPNHIRIDDYAPESNKTAIYLGPVKTPKGVRTIYLPNRAARAFRALKEIAYRYAEEKPDFNQHNLVFCTEDGHCLDTKTLEEGFHQILSDLGLKRVRLPVRADAASER